MLSITAVDIRDLLVIYAECEKQFKLTLEISGHLVLQIVEMNFFAATHADSEAI